MKTTLVLLTLLISIGASAKERIVQREDMTNMSKGSGTNIGGGNTGSEYLATWCKGQTSLLRNFQERALLKLDNTGDYNITNKILVDGMQKALTNSQEAGASFLHKSLIRGLKIATYLDAGRPGMVEKKAMTTYYTLISYYDFMINVVGKQLDLGAQIPYMNASLDEMDQRAATFEAAFVDYARSQLAWITRNLIEERRIGYELEVFPRGDVRSITKIAIVLTAATATDLEDSLWNYRFSCAISDLNTLSESLKLYDQGNMEMFENQKQALGHISKELNRIIQTLRERNSCY